MYMRAPSRRRLCCRSAVTAAASMRMGGGPCIVHTTPGRQHACTATTCIVRAGWLAAQVEDELRVLRQALTNEDGDTKGERARVSAAGDRGRKEVGGGGRAAAQPAHGPCPPDTPTPASHTPLGVLHYGRQTLACRSVPQQSGAARTGLSETEGQECSLHAAANIVADSATVASNH